jgi:hypothetical protein
MTVPIRMIRRRAKLYVAIAVLFTLSVVPIEWKTFFASYRLSQAINTHSQQLTDDIANLLLVKNLDEQVQNVQQTKKRRERITMQTYVAPAPCEMCPGEFGTGANTTVTIPCFELKKFF